MGNPALDAAAWRRSMEETKNLLIERENSKAAQAVMQKMAEIDRGLSTKVAAANDGLKKLWETQAAGGEVTEAEIKAATVSLNAAVMDRFSTLNSHYMEAMSYGVNNPALLQTLQLAANQNMNAFESYSQTIGGIMDDDTRREGLASQERQTEAQLAQSDIESQRGAAVQMRGQDTQASIAAEGFEIDRDRIAAEVRMEGGRQALTRRGQTLEFRIENQRLGADKNKFLASFAPKMFEQIKAMRDEGWSDDQIDDLLDAQGVPETIKSADLYEKGKGIDEDRREKISRIEAAIRRMEQRKEAGSTVDEKQLSELKKNLEFYYGVEDAELSKELSKQRLKDEMDTFEYWGMRTREALKSTLRGVGKTITAPGGFVEGARGGEARAPRNPKKTARRNARGLTEDQTPEEEP